MQDSTVKQVEIIGWTILLLLIMVAFLVASKETVLGFALGGVISLLNFRWLSFLLRRVLSQSEKKAGRWIKTSYFLRYLSIFFILLMTFKQGLVAPIPLVIGLSIIIGAVTLVALWQLIHNLR